MEKFENQQSNNVVDAFWDGWLNSFKAFQDIQTEHAAKSLQVFENQKELLNSTRESLRKLEEEGNKVSEDWKATLQSTLDKVDKDQMGPIISTWMNKVAEINASTDALSFSPSKVMMDMFSQSQEQLQSNVKKVLDQQQQGRTEVLNSVEKLTEQMKQAQKNLIPTV